MTLNGRRVDIRVSSIPTINTSRTRRWSIYMRLLISMVPSLQVSLPKTGSTSAKQ